MSAQDPLVLQRLVDRGLGLTRGQFEQLVEYWQRRSVVAEEALRVAHEDADRLASFIKWRDDCHICGRGRSVCSRCNPAEDVAVLKAHRVAVESRPKAPQPAGGPVQPERKP